MIFTPPRNRGPWLLAALAAVAVLLGAGLILRGATQHVSFAALLAYTAGAALLVVAIPIGYWAYAALTLHYELRRDALLVRWGLVEHIVPLRSIERAVLGRHLAVPSVTGLRLPGLLVGRAEVAKVGHTTVYLRYHSAADLVYLVTSEGAVGLSVEDAQPFVQALARAQREAGAASARFGVRRGALESLAFWADRKALVLGSAALALAWLSTAIVFVRYQARPSTLLLHFPATEAAHLGPRSALLHIPESALAWFGVSAALALMLFARGRLASYLVLASSVFAGALFVIAAVAATG